MRRRDVPLPFEYPRIWALFPPETRERALEIHAACVIERAGVDSTIRAALEHRGRGEMKVSVRVSRRARRDFGGYGKIVLAAKHAESIPAYALLHEIAHLIVGREWWNGRGTWHGGEFAVEVSRLVDWFWKKYRFEMDEAKRRLAADNEDTKQEVTP